MSIREIKNLRVLSGLRNSDVNYLEFKNIDPGKMDSLSVICYFLFHKETIGDSL